LLTRGILSETESRVSRFHREGTSRRRICVNSHRHEGNYWLLVTLRRYEFSKIKHGFVLTLKNNHEYFARAFILTERTFISFPFVTHVHTFHVIFLYYFVLF